MVMLEHNHQHHHLMTFALCKSRVKSPTKVKTCNDLPFWLNYMDLKWGQIKLCESFECLKDETDNNFISEFKYVFTILTRDLKQHNKTRIT